MPCRNPDSPEEYYRCWKSNGSYFDPTKVETKIKIASEQKVKIRTEYLIPESKGGIFAKFKRSEKNNALPVILEELNGLDFQNRGTGIVHDTLLRKNTQLKHLGFNVEEREQILLPYALDEKTRKEIMDIVK